MSLDLKYGGNYANAYKKLSQDYEANVNIHLLQSKRNVSYFIYNQFNILVFDKKEIMMLQLDEGKKWGNLHNRHKVKIGISLIFLIIGIIDSLFSLMKLPSIGNAYMEILWLIGSSGLLGTSVYLAIDAKD